MGWFRSGSTNQAPTYTGLQLQTATNTICIAIVWGIAKISVNVIWYANFQVQQNTGKKFLGGLFGATQPGEITYTADVIMALCEGPISNVAQIWRDQSTYTLPQLGLTAIAGNTPQPVWPYLADNYPAQALAYQGTAYVAAANYQLGPAADLSNHNMEVWGFHHHTGFNGIDADPSLIFNDFLTNPQYGIGFSAASIDMTTLFGASGDNSLQSYCFAQGIALSPALIDQEQASSILTRWLQLCNSTAFWSAGQLKFAPFGDTAIAEGTQTTQTIQVGIPTPVPAVAPAVTAPPSITVAASAAFVSDGGVKYAFSGAPLTYIGASAPTLGNQYGIDPPGTYLFYPLDETQTVAITFTTQVVWGYTPNVTPIYNLGDNDYIDTKDNTDLVQVSRVDPFELATIQRVEISDRNNQYDLTPCEARDLSQIQVYGPRVGSTITGHEICDFTIVGPTVAQAILQRELYVRSNYKFKLGWEYCLLDPMDVVTLTDANLGLADYPVRIISIEEDDAGVLLVTAEELVVGVSTPAVYPTNPNTGTGLNRGAPSDPINSPPLIYEPGVAITNGIPEVWLGASGGSGGVVDPNWGGAIVWASLDDATYAQLANISRRMIQGALTANLALADGYDTTNTLSVDLTESAGTLSTVTMEAAQQGATLCLIGTELVAFTTATLTSAYHYDLTGLQRGVYGSAPAAHASGDYFWRADNTIVQQPLPTNYIGVPLYFKFQSYNTFGAGAQDLALCTPFPYTPNGNGFAAPPQLTFTAFAIDLNATGDTEIAVTLPATAGQYQILNVYLYGASESLTTAQAGVFTGAAQSGVTVAAEQSLSAITSGTPDTPGNATYLTLANSPSTVFTGLTLYFNVGTAQGSAATVNVAVTVAPIA